MRKDRTEYIKTRARGQVIDRMKDVWPGVLEVVALIAARMAVRATNRKLEGVQRLRI